MYKLSTESNEAETVLEFFETKSMNELNFDKIKALLGRIENKTKLLVEHKEGMLTKGNGIVGVRYTESKDKKGVIFPDIALSAGMMEPFAAVNWVPTESKEEIGSIK